MRSCTPLTSAPAPRESTVKSLRHPAAPVVQSSQTRRHPLTPTLAQQLCTHVQSCDQSGLFFWTVHGPFSFPQDGKENGGCIPAGQAPCGSRHPPWPPRRRPIPPPPAAGASAPPSPPPGGPPLPPPPAGKIFLNSQILHRYPLYKRNALRYDNSVSTRRI